MKNPQEINTAAYLGQQIRERRKAQHLSQAALALYIGVGPRFISDLENGKPTAEIGKTLQVIQSLGLKLYLEPRGID